MDESSLSAGSFAIAIFVIMLFAFGLVIGEHVGEEMGGRCVEKRDFHIANLKIIGVGVVASAVVWAVQLLTLAGLVFGLLVGAIAGAKVIKFSLSKPKTYSVFSVLKLNILFSSLINIIFSPIFYTLSFL